VAVNISDTNIGMIGGKSQTKNSCIAHLYQVALKVLLKLWRCPIDLTRGKG